jgi:hypothetical protein
VNDSIYVLVGVLEEDECLVDGRRPGWV